MDAGENIEKAEGMDRYASMSFKMPQEENMQIRSFYGSKSIGVFLLYDIGDEKAPVCEIWCFHRNPNNLVDFWTLAPLLWV